MNYDIKYNYLYSIYVIISFIDLIEIKACFFSENFLTSLSIVVYEATHMEEHSNPSKDSISAQNPVKPGFGFYTKGI